MEQSILLDGMDVNSGSMDIEDVIDEPAPGGEEFCFPHYLENKMSIEGTVELETTYDPDGEGITTRYLKSIPYTYSKVWAGDNGKEVLVTVEDTEEWLEWNYTAVDPVTSGTLKMTVEIDNPTGFGITTFDDGSYDGWYYYDTEDVVRISDYDGSNKISGYDWVETSVDADSMSVRIKKDHLPTTFMWQGFANFHLTQNWIEIDKSADPWVPTASAELMEPLTNPVIIQSGGRLDFSICHAFDEAIAPGTYTITTSVLPK